jgi:1-phosphofructokinase family hexose kinase
MILTVTPNPALDITYHLDHVRLGETNRVRSVAERAGGKGVNVARVLAQLGHAVTCSGFLGGPSGDDLVRLLDGSGVLQRWLPIEGQTRRTIAAVDSDGATLFNEPGPVLDQDAWAVLRDHVLSLTSPGDVVTVSGSTPRGTSPDDVGAFVSALRAHGLVTLVDTSGPHLLAAAKAGADVLKPNHHELRESTGAPDVLSGARRLLSSGAGAVVVSAGEDGVIAVTGTHAWQARPAEVLRGNPTGAGDAAVAALALACERVSGGIALEDALTAHLPDVVALSGAAVLAPEAGAVDLDAYRRMRAAITVEMIDAC